MLYCKSLILVVSILPVLLTDADFSNLDSDIKKMSEQVAEQEDFYYHITGKLGSRSLDISIRSYDYGISVYATRKKVAGFLRANNSKSLFMTKMKPEILQLEQLIK